MQHKSLFAALLCGTLCLTACLKNEESPSVTTVRLAKAEEILANADKLRAEASATITSANAEAKVKEAEAKLREAEAKLREADAAYRLAEADAVKAETQLKLVEIQLREIDVELAKVELESRKVELEARKAELLAQKAEYEARIAAAEVEKLYYESLKQAMELQLQVTLTNLQADLIDAQLAVLQAEKDYADFLKGLEEATEEEYAELRDKVAELAANYHQAARELIDMQESLVKNQYLVAQLENGLASAIDAKNAAIEEKNQEIAREMAYIEALEGYRDDFYGGLTSEDLEDLAPVFYAEYLTKMGQYEQEDILLDEAMDEYDAAFTEFAHNYPILTVAGSGIADANGYESGIVYDYTNALFTTDEITGVNLNNLDYISEYIDNGNTHIDVDFKDEDIDQEWHRAVVYDHRYTYPKDDEIVGGEQYEEIELYRWYQKGSWPMGMKYGEPERYPSLQDGITEDRYEWEDYEYTVIDKVEFVPMVVNKEGFDKYIAIRQEVLDNEIAESNYVIEGMEYFADWFKETFADAAASVEKGLKDSYAEYKKASDALDDADKAYYDAWKAYINVVMKNYDEAVPEQTTLIKLQAALDALEEFIDDNKPDADYWYQEIKDRQTEIELKEKDIADYQKLDADYKASTTYIAHLETLREYKVLLEDAKKALAEAEETLATATSKANEQEAKVKDLYKKYYDAYAAYWDALHTVDMTDPSDPTYSDLVTVKNDLEAAKNAAWNAYYDANNLLSTYQTDVNNAKTAKGYAADDVKSREDNCKWMEDYINRFTVEIDKLNEEIGALQDEIDTIHEEHLAAYEKELATLTDDVDTLEAEWKAIDDANKATPEWAAVEAAEQDVKDAEEEYKKADDAWQLVQASIYSAKYFNEEGYDYYSDAAFPGFNYATDWYTLAPKNYDSSSDFWDLIDYLELLIQFTDNGEYWRLLENFYDGLIPMSLGDMVNFYHFFTDELGYPYQIAEAKKAVEKKQKEEQEKIDDIQARLDKVMAGEDVYNEGIQKANELYENVIAMQKAYWDQKIVTDAAYVEYAVAYNMYYNVSSGSADIQWIETQIEDHEKNIEALEQEINDWKAIFDDEVALAKLKSEITVLESEIEIQEALVQSWKQELDKAMEELTKDFPAEESSEEPEEPVSD